MEPQINADERRFKWFDFHKFIEILKLSIKFIN